MSGKRKKSRQIVVDGQVWCYRIGHCFTILEKLNSTIKLRIHNWKLAECDKPDTFERGQWKQTSDGMITPAKIERYLRSYDEQ